MDLPIGYWVGTVNNRVAGLAMIKALGELASRLSAVGLLVVQDCTTMLARLERVRLFRVSYIPQDRPSNQ